MKYIRERMPNATLQSISSGGTSPQQCQPLAVRSTSKCRAQFFRRARSALRPNKWLQTELTSHLKVAGDVHLCHQALPRGRRACLPRRARLLSCLGTPARASRQSGCVGSAALGAGAAAAANPSSASAQPRACTVWWQRLVRTGIEQQWIAKTADTEF